MRRRLYLDFNRGAWYGVRHYEDFTPSGERIIRKQRIHLGVKGKENRRKAERALAVMDRETIPEPAPTGKSTVREWLERWLREMASVRPSTLAYYARACRLFIQRYGDRDLRSIRRDDVVTFRSACAATRTEASANSIVRPLAAAFAAATAAGILNRNPFAGLKKLDEQRAAAPDYWTEAEFRHFIAACVNQRQRTAFALAFYAGLRAGEIVNLRWEDVEGDVLVVASREGSRRTKSGKSRAIPIAPQLRAEIDATERSGEYVVLGRQGKPTPAGSLSWSFALIRKKVPFLPSLSLHGLRHSFATNLAIKGVPIQHIQNLLGHATIATTMVYAHPSNDAVIGAVRWAFEDDRENRRESAGHPGV